MVTAIEEPVDDIIDPEEPQTTGLVSGDGTIRAGQTDLKTIARRFALLGAIAFGGPPAHVALMQVQSWRMELLDDAAFASLFALTQCLPGPSSTQLAIALGILQGGLYGGLVAFLSFSAVATSSMAILGSLVHASSGLSLGTSMDALLRAIGMGLSAAAVALVAKAALMLSTKLAVDPLTRGLCVAAAAAAVLAPGTSWVLPTALVAAGLASNVHAYLAPKYGWNGAEGVPVLSAASVIEDVPVSRQTALGFLGAWAGVGALLMLVSRVGGPWWIQLVEPFYRVGSIVWGGGPVVLPMLLREVRGRGCRWASGLGGTSGERVLAPGG